MDRWIWSSLLSSVSESLTFGGILPKTLFGSSLLMARVARVLFMCVNLLVPLGAAGMMSNGCEFSGKRFCGCCCGCGIFENCSCRCAEIDNRGCSCSYYKIVIQLKIAGN